jgi:hypothetical protein
MLEFNLVRGIVILIVFTAMAFFFIIMGIKISRNTSYSISNKVFLAGTFFLYALGASINICYFILANLFAILHNEAILLILYSIVITILFTICAFYIIFQHSKRNVNFTPKYRYLGAGIFIACIFPLNLVMGFNFMAFNEYTGWAPFYYPEYAVYFGSILLVFIILEIREAYKIYNYLKVHIKQTSAIYWKRFNIGILGIPSIMLILPFSLITLDPLLRDLGSISFIFFFVFAVLIYSGLTGKKSEKKVHS